MAFNLGSVKSKETLAVQGVYFQCPQLGPELLSKEEWKVKIRKYLYRQMEIDKCKGSCLIIHSLNRKTESKKCIETIESIINNLMLYPDEDKYKKIKIMNRVFQDKISKIEGAIEFLESVGFMKVEADNSEDCYIFSSKPDIPSLQEMLNLLLATKPISLELSRNVIVMKPNEVQSNIELPDDFYFRSPDDIKREQLRRIESLENSKILRTREVREAEKQKNTNKYRYTLIRIRFPDGIVLQATFKVFEKLSAVKSFVCECIIDSVGPFELTTGLGILLPESDNNKTLQELKLLPAVLLTFVPTKMLPTGHSYLVPGLQKK